MKKIIFICFILLTGCTTKPINQSEKQTETKKTNQTQTPPKDSWIYNSPWGQSAIR